jgi:hypothetical protein
LNTNIGLFQITALFYGVLQHQTLGVCRGDVCALSLILIHSDCLQSLWRSDRDGRSVLCAASCWRGAIVGVVDCGVRLRTRIRADRDRGRRLSRGTVHVCEREREGVARASCGRLPCSDAEHQGAGRLRPIRGAPEDRRASSRICKLEINGISRPLSKEVCVCAGKQLGNVSFTRGGGGKGGGGRRRLPS